MLRKIDKILSLWIPFLNHMLLHKSIDTSAPFKNEIEGQTQLPSDSP